MISKLSHKPVEWILPRVKKNRYLLRLYFCGILAGPSSAACTRPQLLEELSRQQRVKHPFVNKKMTAGCKSGTIRGGELQQPRVFPCQSFSSSVFPARRTLLVDEDAVG
jgi:hypothetical protein